MPISHTREFGVYHWDTFDNETILLYQCDTLDAAETYVRQRYGNRIDMDRGADQVDIVDSKGNTAMLFKVT